MVGFGVEFYVLVALVFIGGIISICVNYDIEKKAKLSDLAIARICDIKFSILDQELDELKEEIKKLKDEIQSVRLPEEFALTSEEKEKFRKMFDKQAHG